MKLAYVDELVRSISIDGSGNYFLELNQSEIDESRLVNLRSKVEQVFDDMFKTGFEPDIKIIDDKTRNAFTYVDDPLPELMKQRQLLAEGTGYFGLGPLLAQLADAIEDRIKEIAGQLRAQSYRFPALISPSYLEKVKYFSNFPHSLCFVTHLREDLDVIRNFAAHGHTHDGAVVTDTDSFSGCQAMLSPTVCHHLYMMLADSEIPSGGLVATAFGNCFRYEASNLISLERLWNFSMREIIFVGDQDTVDAGLETAGKMIFEMLAELDIGYRVETATDPFFVANYRDYVAYQSAFELKQEVRAQLPYKSDTIAVGSFNRHQDFFGRTLDIRLQDGNPACTGCIGFGFERLVLSFIAQQGLDQNAWPDRTRKFLKIK